MRVQYDAIVIGGGFFGLNIALYLIKELGQKNILIIEKEPEVMLRASYNNQARVHAGYHYPRSLLTALRSQVNFPKFTEQYEQAIVNDFDKYYAIAKNFSKVSSRQFELFSKRINAEISEASNEIKQLFNPYLTENVYKVKEYAFDAGKLRKMLLKQLEETNVHLVTGLGASMVQKGKNGLEVIDEKGGVFTAKKVFNCAYSLINKINLKSDLPLIPFKHELAEMCLIKLPKQISHLSVTMMCGPFFSFMPFPDKSLHTLSHVRYTPHSEWNDMQQKYRDGHHYLSRGIKRITHFPQMISDAKRYIPLLKESDHVDSLWEVKTVLTQSEHDDSRPILFKADHGLKGYACIMGGKLDNIYDVYRELDHVYA